MLMLASKVGLFRHNLKCQTLLLTTHHRHGFSHTTRLVSVITLMYNGCQQHVTVSKCSGCSVSQGTCGRLYVLLMQALLLLRRFVSCAAQGCHQLQTLFNFTESIILCCGRPVCISLRYKIPAGSRIGLARSACRGATVLEKICNLWAAACQENCAKGILFTFKHHMLALKNKLTI